MHEVKNNRLFTIVIPILLFLIAFVWKLFFIDYRDICIDEPFIAFHAQKSAGEIIRLSATKEPNPPLFLLLTGFWVKVFGIGPFSLRFLPLVFNSLTVLFIYFTGKRFFNIWTALIASGMFLLSTLHFFHGVNARVYSLVSLETAAALYFFLRYANNLGDRKAFAGLLITNLLLVYSHYFGWFVILSQVVTGFFFIRGHKTFFRLMLPPFLTFIGFLPMVPAVYNLFIAKSDPGTWLNAPNPIDFLLQIYRFLNFKPAAYLILAILGVGLLYLLLILIIRKRIRPSTNTAVLLLWWLLPYTLMFLISTRLPIFNNNYNLFNSIGLYLFIAAAIGFLFQWNRYLEPVFGILVVAVMGYYLKILPKDFSYREVSKSVEMVKKYKDDDTVVILYPFWSDLQFTYYYDRDIFRDYENFEEEMRKK
jgi:uncharacterized membrane protein